MENADEIELESSKDGSNKDMEIDNGKKSEEQNNFTEVTSGFLTASELQSLRCNLTKNKSKEDDLELYKGPKLYHPNESEAPEEIIEDILNNAKKSLELQRIAKNRDCIKAQWNEELKVAIVPYLKGKTTQHMGINMKGNISLLPEEALFLLEKGSIEVEHNKIPLSVEEAYSVMLKERLSVEKYQVYSFLSQQGFIVVKHRSSLCSKNEKPTTSLKQKQKKRKAPSGELPEPKRLTFSGAISSRNDGVTLDSADAENNALSSSCLLNVDDASDNTLSVSQETPGSDKNISDAQNRDEIQSQDFSKNDAISSNLSSGTESNALTGKETELSCFQDKNAETDIVKINDQEHGGFFSNLMEKSNKDLDTLTKGNDNASRTDQNEEDNIDVETVIDDGEICVNNLKDVDMNEVIIDDDQGKDKSSDINVEDIYSGYSDNEESTDEDAPLVLEESNDESSLDVYSYSPELSLNTDNLLSQPTNEDDEITLVKVTKKEKKPLAVIDLLSDEEDQNRADLPFVVSCGQSPQETTNGRDMFDDSDDEIQVLEECNGSASTAQVVNRNGSAVKLESEKMKEEASNVKTQYKPLIKFPELYRKDLLCISRPPGSLLPLRVKPAKEAYVLNLTKSSQPTQGRLWNSYKDMQDYQRERRLERRMNSFGGRSSGPFRNQNDSYSYQTQSVPFGRNSHQQNHGRFPILPNPGPLNSANSVPLSMNIYNLQNLSSNPVAFATELQKTVMSVATNMVSSIFSQMTTMNPLLPPNPGRIDTNIGFPPHPMNNNFSTPPPGMPGPAGYNSFGRNDFNHMRFPPDPAAFSGERYPFPPNRSPFAPENSWRPPNAFHQRNFHPRGPLFPCRFRSVNRKRNWNDIKAVVGESSHSDSGSDIEEVPINFNQFLITKEIQPLVKPGSKLPIRDVLKALRITQMANLCDTKHCVDRYLPSTPVVEISFDVYPPNSKYKKSDPAVPKYRIIVVKSSDPIVRYSELVFLQRNFNDKASLQVAVVDHGDISFFSFKSINVPEMVPFES